MTGLIRLTTTLLVSALYMAGPKQISRDLGKFSREDLIEVTTVSRKQQNVSPQQEYGREALAALDGGDFDAVSKDVQMPEMSGFGAMAIIRE